MAFAGVRPFMLRSKSSRAVLSWMRWSSRSTEAGMIPFVNRQEALEAESRLQQFGIDFGFGGIFSVDAAEAPVIPSPP